MKPDDANHPQMERVSVYFFSNERDEPPHIHVDKSGNSAKFWLLPVSLSRNFGYPDRELNRLHAKIVEHEVDFLRAWYEHAGRKD